MLTTLGEQGGPRAAGSVLTPGCCSPGRPHELHEQGECLVGVQLTSCFWEAHPATGPTLHERGAFCAQCLSPRRYLWGTHQLSSLAPHFKEAKYQAGALLWSSLSTAYRIPQGSWALPQQGQWDLQAIPGRCTGASSCKPPIPGPPYTVSCESALLLALEMIVS